MYKARASLPVRMWHDVRSSYATLFYMIDTSRTIRGVSQNAHKLTNKSAQYSTRAFTLIELLVVIAIIGILSAVVLASLNTARAKARDTSRIQALKEVQKALEMYYADNGAYPLAVSHQGTQSSGSCYGSLGNDAIPGLVPNYISTLPQEVQFPALGASSCFLYRSGSGGNEYKFMAHGTMETCAPGSCPLQDPQRPAQKTSAVYSVGGTSL